MDEEIKSVLEKAEKLVSVASISQEFKVVAFREVFRLLWENKPTGLAVSQEETPQRPADADADADVDVDVLSTIVNMTGLPRNEISDIYEVDENREIQLLKTQIPGKSRREQQRNLAVLLLWPNKLMGRGKISAQKISWWMNEFNLYDRNLNLLARTKYIAGSGKGKGMKYHLKTSGDELAKSLIRRILGRE